jgi:hypothetical protein
MSRSDRSGMMMDRDESMEDAMADPMPLGYPFAAPGAIDLYHFRTYKGIMVDAGSATDARYHHDRMQDEMRMHSTSMRDEDEDDIDPMPLNYPFAAPGAVDLYHFHSYRGITLEAGSATDARWQKMRNKDMKRMQMMHESPSETERLNRSDNSAMYVPTDADMIDPAPIGYPFAAPGAIDLYHFRSYAGITLRSGSVTDARYQKQRDLDRRRMREQRNANSPDNMGNSAGNNNANQ